VDEAKKILNSYWHHANFRPQQAEIIQSVLKGEDVLAVLPTGGGKSLCYQIPAMMMEGLCLVVSPLIALMKDQVQALQSKKIPAAAIYSGMEQDEIMRTYHKALDGKLKLLYISPERLQTLTFNKFFKNTKISFAAIDEAHCVSQWGFDFRPKYLEINSLREIHPNLSFLALTATATKVVQDDISLRLGLRSFSSYSAPFLRENLLLTAKKVVNKTVQILDILAKTEGSTIIYSRNRKLCRDLAQQLNEHGHSSTYYHAGLNREERDKAQNAWKRGEVRIIVGTNAFGMGIDKENVRCIIHYHMPTTPEAYYQEIGRAGRDGQDAHCILLYNDTDLSWPRSQIKSLFPSVKHLREIYSALATYLKIPLAFGANRSYAINLTDFIEENKIDARTTVNALKLLARQKVWEFEENVSLRSKIRVTASRKDLDLLAERFPHLFEMVQLLLRLYGGIMQHQLPIDEWTLAKKLRRSYTQIEEELKELNMRSYIKYQEKNDRPRIFLLQDRTTKERLVLDESLILRLKTRHTERLDCMQEFVEMRDACRMQFIAAYFSEETENCGRCDNCQKKNETSLSPKKVQESLKDLLLDRKHIPLVEFVNHFPASQNEEIKKIIRYLIEEKHVKVNSFGALENNG